MKTGKLIAVIGAIILLTSLFNIGIGLSSRLDIGIYLIMTGAGILSFILGLYIQLKGYILLLNRPADMTYKRSLLNLDAEITDDDISEEIERHMESHRH